MTDADITELVSRALRETFPNAFLLSAEAMSEVDVDGSPILKVVARFQHRPMDPEAPAEAIHEIRRRLLAEGEERFILLSNEYVDHPEEIEEDVG